MLSIKHVRQERQDQYGGTQSSSDEYSVVSDNSSSMQQYLTKTKELTDACLNVPKLQQLASLHGDITRLNALTGMSQDNAHELQGLCNQSDGWSQLRLLSELLYECYMPIALTEKRLKYVRVADVLDGRVTMASIHEWQNLALKAEKATLEAELAALKEENEGTAHAVS